MTTTTISSNNNAAPPKRFKPVIIPAVPKMALRSYHSSNRSSTSTLYDADEQQKQDIKETEKKAIVEHAEHTKPVVTDIMPVTPEKKTNEVEEEDDAEGILPDIKYHLNRLHQQKRQMQLDRELHQLQSGSTSPHSTVGCFSPKSVDTDATSSCGECTRLRNALMDTEEACARKDGEVRMLQEQVSALQAQFASMQGHITMLQNQLGASNNMVANELQKYRPASHNSAPPSPPGLPHPSMIPPSPMPAPPMWEFQPPGLFVPPMYGPPANWMRCPPLPPHHGSFGYGMPPPPPQSPMGPNGMIIPPPMFSHFHLPPPSPPVTMSGIHFGDAPTQDVPPSTQ